MKNKNKIAILKHIMERYDHYYDSVNNKANVYLTLNTFILGGIITGYYSVKDQTICDKSVFTLMVASLIFCVLSIGYTLWATIPYLTKQSDSIGGSIIYFGNVANISFYSFKQMCSDINKKKCYDDYLQQVHLLAIGLQNKFNRLKIATYLLGGCFVCIIIIGLKLIY